MRSLPILRRARRSASQVGYFLVEDAVARTAGWAGAAGAEGHLDIVAQVRGAPEFRRASLPAMLLGTA